jgi:hypothetical protein
MIESKYKQTRNEYNFQSCAVPLLEWDRHHTIKIKIKIIL